MKTDKLTHVVSSAVRFVQIKLMERKIDMMAALTIQDQRNPSFLN